MGTFKYILCFLAAITVIFAVRLELYELVSLALILTIWCIDEIVNG